MWCALEDYGDEAFGASLGYRQNGVPGEVWFPTAYPFCRLVLILGFAVANCALGYYAMGIFETDHIPPYQELEDRLLASLWWQQPNWLVVPAGCAIEATLAQTADAKFNNEEWFGVEAITGSASDNCHVDLSYVSPWTPHERMSITTYCGRPSSGDNSCASMLGKDCSELSVGIVYGGTCYASSESPHAARLVFSKADSLRKVHAVMDEVSLGFKGPMGASSASRLVQCSAVLLLLAIMRLLCDVVTDKWRVRTRKRMLAEGRPGH